MRSLLPSRDGAITPAQTPADSSGQRHVLRRPEAMAATSFFAEEWHRAGFVPSLHHPAVLVTLGSSAWLVGRATLRRMETEYKSIPQPIGYLLVDSQSHRPEFPPGHELSYNDGCGTLPEEGRAFSREHALEFRNALSNQFDRVFEPDPQSPVHIRQREALDVWIAAGPGATGGGLTQPMIDLTHEAGRDLEVQHVRVHVLLIGPEIIIIDRTRTLTPGQQSVLRATEAVNLTRLLSDWSSPDVLTIPRVAGGTFPLQASDRVWAIAFADHSNGCCQFATVADLACMLGDVLFTRLTTQLGPELAALMINWHVLGDTGKYPKP